MLLPILFLALSNGQEPDLETLRVSHGIGAWDDQVVALPASAGRNVTIPLELGGHSVHLELSAHSVRTPDFQMHVQAGGELIEVEPPPSCTYRGTISEWVGSRAIATIHAGELRATIRDAGGTYWAVEPVSGLGRGDTPGLHVSYHESALAPGTLLCTGRQGPEPPPNTGPRDPSLRVEAGELDTTSPPPLHRSSAPQFAELAVDADYEYFLLKGNVARTQIAMETRIAAVSFVYEADFDMSWVISESIVRTDPNDDPYADYGCNYSILAGLVADHWRYEQARKHRDAVHLFSDKWNVGLFGAATGYVCSCGAAAASRENLSFELIRTILVAHELGHVMGAGHCNGNGDCFIMCGGVGGCDGPLLDFGFQAEMDIGSTIASAACITEVPTTMPPVIGAVVPNPVPMLGYTNIQVQGTDLGELLSGLLDFGTSSHMIDCIPLSSSSEVLAVFPLPTPPSLGPATLTLTNHIGESNAVTVTFVETSPPLMVGPPAIYPHSPLSPPPWMLGAGAADDVRILVAINDDTTFETATGVVVLANAAVADTQTLDHLGLGRFMRNIPPPLSGSTLYTQFLVVDSAGTILESSNIVSTEIL